MRTGIHDGLERSKTLNGAAGTDTSPIASVPFILCILGVLRVESKLGEPGCS
jgi:hypothetical protein